MGDPDASESVPLTGSPDLGLPICDACGRQDYTLRIVIAPTARHALGLSFLKSSATRAPSALDQSPNLHSGWTCVGTCTPDSERHFRQLP
jgi:hypothetical protein